MSEEVPQEESSYSQDLSSSNVPHMIISGNLKDGSREGNHACVTRFCTIKITRLEIDDASALPSNFVITVQLDRSRKSLTSIPLDLKQFEDKQLNLDFSFAFLYTHNLKPPSDYLKIYIQEKKKKKSLSDQRIYASTVVNLHRVLQCTLEDEIVLTAPKSKKKEEKKKDESNKTRENWKRESDVREPKKERRDSEPVKKSDTKENLSDVLIPVLHMNVTVTVYPDDVDSYQDAQEWDEEFLDTLMMEPKNDYSTDEEDLYESDEFTDNEEENILTASPQAKTNIDNNASPLPLSEVLRSRYQISTQKKEKRSKLNFKRVLKQIKREKKDEMFQNEEVNSLGSSSGSEEEEEVMSGPESPPPTKTKPLMIRPNPAISYELTPPASPVFLTPASEDSNMMILVDTQKRRGRRFEECMKEIKSLSNKTIGTKNYNDISAALSSIISKQSRSSTDLSELSLENSTSPIRVVIAGGDKYINYVLRPFVEILSKKPRGWQVFSFFIVPLGKKNDIAMHIASLDSVYKSLFFNGDWASLFGDQSEIKEIEKRVLKYLDEANVVYPFQIAEALLAFSHASQTSNAPAVTKNIPFIKGLTLGTRDSEETDTADLQLDYWYPKKKGEGHKDVKTFQFTAITRLPAVANALHIEPEYKPTPTTFSLLVQFKDKSKMEKMREALQHLGGKNKKKEDDIQIVTAKINRLTCSSATDTTVFRVLIDGVEWTGVTFVSVSPQWHSHIKTFPIQIFNKSLSKSNN